MAPPPPNHLTSPHLNSAQHIPAQLTCPPNAQGPMPAVPLLPSPATPALKNVVSARPRGHVSRSPPRSAWSLLITTSVQGVNWELVLCSQPAQPPSARSRHARQHAAAGSWPVGANSVVYAPTVVPIQEIGVRKLEGLPQSILVVGVFWVAGGGVG